MAAPCSNNGMELYGHHDESNRLCNNMHQLARFNGTHKTNWVPLCHHMSNLEQVLCGFLNKQNNKLTDWQMAGYSALRSLLRYDIPPKPALLIAALDTIFFGGLSNNRMRVNVIDIEDDEGQTGFLDDLIPRTAAAVVTVHNSNGRNDSYYRTRPQERRLRIWSTLMHELCHAFLLIYGCDGREYATKQEVVAGRGFTGHDPAWQRVARNAQMSLLNESPR